MQKPLGGSEREARALFLSPEAPYPTVGGGALRSASMLEYLCRHYAVDAIFFQQPGASDPGETIPEGRIRRSVTIRLPYHSRKPIARVLRNAGRIARNRPPLLDRFSGFGERITEFIADAQYQLAVIEHFWCAPYIDRLRPRSDWVWLDLHNVESVWHQRLSANGSWVHARVHEDFARSYFELEKIWLPKFDNVLVTSTSDGAEVRRIAPRSNLTVYPNALPGVPVIEKIEQDVIAFSGNLEYEPNKGAVRFFANEIWPRLRETHPRLQWRIIGKNSQAVKRFVLHDPRIELVGPVEDAIAALACAKIAVVPLLAGSGTRIKILEAWAAGTAVVSTSMGAEGLDCEPGEHLLIADDPITFAARVSELLACGDRRIRVGEAGRRLCQERYTWQSAWLKLDLPGGTKHAFLC